MVSTPNIEERPDCPCRRAEQLDRRRRIQAVIKALMGTLGAIPMGRMLDKGAIGLPAEPHDLPRAPGEFCVTTGTAWSDWNALRIGHPPLGHWRACLPRSSTPNRSIYLVVVTTSVDLWRPPSNPLQRRLTETEIDDLLTRYEVGSTIEAVVKEFGVHPATVMTHLEHRGIPRSAPRKLADQTVTDASRSAAVGPLRTDQVSAHHLPVPSRMVRRRATHRGSEAH